MPGTVTASSKRSGSGRSRTGTYARGTETRLHIIETALDVFGALGFDEASTRMIADRAGVNLAALHYYFASKQGLYHACAEHIASYGETIVAPFVSRIDSALADPRTTPRQLRALLRETLDAMADRLVSPNDPPTWIAFVLREQTNPTTVYKILHERVSGRLIGAMAALVGRLTGQPAKSEETILRTFAMLGPLVVFQRARGATLHTLGWNDFSGSRLAKVKTVMWDQALGALGLPPERRRP
jgi:TetR/AcrR family transcriptional regulator, regulator of cefoperazone and chloramphenicol sensitivity